MRERKFHLSATIIYVLALTSIYALEISPKWGYLGFPSLNFHVGTAVAIVASAVSALAIPAKAETRGFLLAVSHYLYFIPALVFLGATGPQWTHLSALLFGYSLMVLFSMAPLRAPTLIRISRRGFVVLIYLFLGLSLASSIFYGGLANFNINFSDVYTFRREVEDRLPAIFGYINSGAAKVVAPLAVIFAIHYRNILMIVISSSIVISMFGITQHKSVIFLTVAAAIFYWFLRRATNLRGVAYFFLGILTIALLEVASKFALGDASSGLFNSYIVRRGLFIPTLVDSFYLDFFVDRAKFYWSSSRFGLGIVENPYGQSAPFLIGREYFGSAETSANSGMLGSGYANAGLLGVFLYAMLTGCLLALLQAYGRIIGHAVVSAASFSVVVSTVTSADFATVLLSHGLILLICFLAIFPRPERRRAVR